MFSPCPSVQFLSLLLAFCLSIIHQFVADVALYAFAPACFLECESCLCPLGFFLSNLVFSCVYILPPEAFWY